MNPPLLQVRCTSPRVNIGSDRRSRSAVTAWNASAAATTSSSTSGTTAPPFPSSRLTSGTSATSSAPIVRGPYISAIRSSVW